MSSTSTLTSGVLSGPQLAPQTHEKLEALDQVPLLMQSLPDEHTDNVALSALQSLAYDGTPDEIAQNFKGQGNEYFKEKRYREALGFYTQGVDAQPTDVALREALLCNRAACNLELENYGSVLRDCAAVLAQNARSSKALYRSAMALVALDRLEEAIEHCDRCLSFDKDNQSVQKLRDRANQTLGTKRRKEEERLQSVQRAKRAKQLLSSALRERHFVMIPRADSTDDSRYEPQFDPEDPTGGTLMIPVFLLYPQHSTSDVIPQFVENTPFSMHLSRMFPPEAPAPEWDKNGEYTNGSLVVYAATHRKRLLKVGKKMTLRDVCLASKEKEGELRDGLELVDGGVRLFVVPRGEVEAKWVEEWKRTEMCRLDKIR